MLLKLKYFKIIPNNVAIKKYKQTINKPEIPFCTILSEPKNLNFFNIMLLRPIDDFFAQQTEPNKSCLLSLRWLLLKKDVHITEEWKYKLPSYYYKGRMLCYLWIHKKYNVDGVPQPYIGIVDGNKLEDADLITEKRVRMKILLIDPTDDIPVERIERLIHKLIQLRG